MPPHDSSYKQFFSHRQMVKDLIIGFIHEDWVKALDFDTLESVKSSFITDDLRQREDDVIWRLRWGKEWIYVYLLIEFQSKEDKFMAVRIMNYVSLLYQDLIKQGQLTTKKRLPPVFPIVLYNGKRRWKAPQNIQKLVEPVSGGLENYCPSMNYLLLDQGAIVDAEGIPLELQNLAAALFRLEHSRSEEDLMQVVGHLVKWLNTPEQREVRRAFTAWLVQSLLPDRFPEINNLPPMDDLYEVQTMLAERVKEWSKRWEEKGISIGEKRGISIGEKRGISIGEKRGEKRGEKQGAIKKAQAVARNLIKYSQMSDELIAQITELTQADIQRLRNEPNESTDS